MLVVGIGVVVLVQHVVEDVQRGGIVLYFLGGILVRRMSSRMA